MSTRPRASPGALSIEVARILNEAFEDSKLSQTSLGNLVGLSQSQVSLLLRAKTFMTIDELDDFCRELGLSLAGVLNEADQARH